MSFRATFFVILSNILCHSERSEESGAGLNVLVNQYHVYIMSSHRGTLYIGVTNNLMRRVYEHRHVLSEGFTKKYNITKLVYYEVTEDINSAIAREKQIKGWLRSKKVALIESSNPYWQDLAEAWYAPNAPDPSLHSG